jgi:hypothetical protein
MSMPPPKKLSEEEKEAIENELLPHYGGPDWKEAVRKFAHNRGLTESQVIAYVLFIRAKRSAHS